MCFIFSETRRQFEYLRGREDDLERERTGLRIGERLRRRPMGDLLGGLRARLGGELHKNIYFYLNSILRWKKNILDPNGRCL